MMQHTTLWIWLWLSVTLLLGCKPTAASYDDELMQAESRIGEEPDSVYAFLKQMDPAILSSADRALYHLLWTEAEDKLYIPHTTDSVVSESRSYFEKSGDVLHAAKAWYLTGRIHSDWEQWKEATGDLLNAQKLLADSEDYALKGRIAYYLGLVNFQNRLYETARYHYKDAYHYFVSASDSSGMADAFHSIGNTFLPEHRTDSILYFYREARFIAQQIGNEKLSSVICGRIGYIYIDMQQLDSAAYYLKEAIASARSFIPYGAYSNLGKLYVKMNQLDSAKHYLTQSLKSPILRNQYMGYRYLAAVARKEQDLRLAQCYEEKTSQLRDSIEQSEKTEDVIALQHKHKEQTLAERSQESQSRLNWLHGMLMVVWIGAAAFVIKYLLQRIRWGQRELTHYKQKQQELLSAIAKNRVEAEQMETVKKQLQADALHDGERIDSLEKEMDRLNHKNGQLKESLYSLALWECKHRPFLKHLFSQKSTTSVFTSADWDQFYIDFDQLFPGYRKSFDQSFPKMPLKQKQFCYLLLLSIKLPKIAAVLDLQTATLSVYKINIRKNYFHQMSETSLDSLLRDFLFQYL